MKIAIPSGVESPFQPFEEASEINIYYTENERIVNKEILNAKESGYSLPELLSHENIDLLLCGKLSSNFKLFLRSQNIEFHTGVFGNCDRNAIRFLSGETLVV